MLKELIREELIFEHISFKNKEELFKHIQINASAIALVSDEFSKKLHERELSFPTGLELKGLNVAIPHTDPEFVKKQFIALYTLEEPVLFNRMDDPNKETEVSVVFVLGLNEPHAQLEILQELMGKLQDETFIKGIYEQKNKLDIFKKF